MSNAAILAGPILLAGIVGAMCLGAVLYGVRAWVRAVVAARARSLAEAERARIPVTIFHRQAEAIDAVIAELDSRPATYATFPADVLDMLYSAHDTARELERGQNES